MRRFMWRMMLSVAAVVAAGTGWAAEREGAPRPEDRDERPAMLCAVYLDDQSQINGKIFLSAITIATGYAKFAIPTREVTSITAQKDKETFLVELRNRDRITGALSLPVLEVDTAVGHLSIPPERITKLVLKRLPAPAAPGSVYDVTFDFSISNENPNGVWSYGWMPQDFGAFALYTGKRSRQDAPQERRDFRQWFREPASGDWTPAIWRNDSAEVRSGVGDGQVSLHPGRSNEASVLRWTAPADGTYQIEGEFFAGDSGVMQVGVRQGASWLWQGVDAGTFSLARTLKAGESLDFAVYGGYSSGNTPVEVTIRRRE